MYIGEYLGYQPGAVLAQCMLCTCNRDNMEALLWKAMSSFIQRLEDNFNSVSNLIYNSIGILRCIYRNFLSNNICKKLDTNIFFSPFCFSHYYNLPYINSQLFKHYSLYNYTLYELLDA